MKNALSVMLVVLLSSCNSKRILFSAVKESPLTTERLEIYEDFTYSAFLNDSVIKKGTAKLFDDNRLLLSDEPKSYNQSLIHNKEYIINGHNLCALVFEKHIDTTKTELQIPQKVTKETDCYNITRDFK